MRIEIVVVAAILALASAAPQWPYRDAVAPYYYGYPGKTPYMYKTAGEEDDEMDETHLARQDLKVAQGSVGDGGSTVTVVEDDEKAEGVRVVETGVAKPVSQLVAQDQPIPAVQPAQGNQPLPNNAAGLQQQQPNGQPLTVQQPGANGQQPPAFPPARPPQKRPAEEDEDEDEEDEESEEDDEDAEDDEEGDDDDDEEDEEDEEDRKRNDVVKDSQEEAVVPVIPVVQSQVIPAPVVDTSDEVVEPEVPAVPTQAEVVNSKLNKNKDAVAVAAAGKPKKKPVVAPVGTKVKNPAGGAIEALVPGYVTDQGEVLVPVDTVTGSQPITIVPDPFSRPSRIVGGPRPIPQSVISGHSQQQVPYWYRSSHASNPFTEPRAPAAKQTLYSSVPPPGSIFTFDDDDQDDDVPVSGDRLRQDDDDAESEEDEEDEEKTTPAPQKVPLAAIPASGPSGEDDEADALKFKQPAIANAPRPAKKPSAAPAEESEESEEDDVDSEEDEEEDDSARANAMKNKGRMYVDEDYVSFPPSRTPTILAVIQGKYPSPYGPGPQFSQSQRYSNVYSTPNPYRPDQRYVVRVTPARRPQPPSNGPLYYRPYESETPNKRVTPVASFDVSVEDTRPDSDEEESITVPAGGPGPSPFVYKVQGSVQSVRFPYGEGSGGPGLAYYAASLGPRPGSGPGPRPFGYGPRPSGPRPKGPRPGGFGGPGPRPGPYGRPPFNPSSSSFNPYAFLQQAALSGGPPRPQTSGGPPVIVRRKPTGPHDRPPKPQFIAVYNAAGQKEPVDEEYYTYEVPETNIKIAGRPSPSGQNNKRPTVHRKPTPVIHQKVMSEDEEDSDEPGPIPLQRSFRRRGGKQMKTKKKLNTPKKTKTAAQQSTDPLGLFTKTNKKSKTH